MKAERNINQAAIQLENVLASTRNCGGQLQRIRRPPPESGCAYPGAFF